jgi:hypothetical protein
MPSALSTKRLCCLIYKPATTPILPFSTITSITTRPHYYSIRLPWYNCNIVSPRQTSAAAAAAAIAACATTAAAANNYCTN